MKSGAERKQNDIIFLCAFIEITSLIFSADLDIREVVDWVGCLNDQGIVFYSN